MKNHNHVHQMNQVAAEAFNGDYDLLRKWCHCDEYYSDENVQAFGYKTLDELHADCEKVAEYIASANVRVTDDGLGAILIDPDDAPAFLTNLLYIAVAATAAADVDGKIIPLFVVDARVNKLLEDDEFKAVLYHEQGHVVKQLQVNPQELACYNAAAGAVNIDFEIDADAYAVDAGLGKELMTALDKIVIFETSDPEYLELIENANTISVDEYREKLLDLLVPQLNIRYDAIRERMSNMNHAA